MYLFNTDIITNIFKKSPSESLLAQLDAVPRQEQFITTVTISELVYGAAKSSRPEYHLANLENILLPSVNVVSFDAKAASVCGQLRASLEARGMHLDLADLEIAAIAIAGEFTLITGNTKHFERVPGLRLENWL